MKCIIISCFAGVGKNYAFNYLIQHGYKVDSIEKYRDFYDIYPTYNDYIKDIKNRAKINDVLFIPYFLGMDNRYIKGKIQYTLIYPDKKLKYVYINRFKELGFTDEQIKYLYDNFYIMIKDCDNSNCDRVKLMSENEYCLDIILNMRNKSILEVFDFDLL